MACQPANSTGVASSTLLQMPTQASQIWTPGPPMSRVTSLSDLPQNEHLSFFRRFSASMRMAFVKDTLTITRRLPCVKAALTRLARLIFHTDEHKYGFKVLWYPAPNEDDSRNP